jgi:hypothetical protein
VLCIATPFLAAACGLLVSQIVATGSLASAQPGTALWPRPHDTLALGQRAGLSPARHEFFTYHVHAHLDIFLNRKPIQVPAALGINILDPGVRKFKAPDGSTAYGGIAECNKPCINQLHTHDDTGIIHTEAPTRHSFQLGQFFREWNVQLSSTCVGQYCAPKQKVAAYVGGKRYASDPAKIVLNNHEEIAIVIGIPPSTIPSTYNFGGL